MKAIEIANVSKLYRIKSLQDSQRYVTLREVVTSRLIRTFSRQTRSAQEQIISAIDNVSFDVSCGERIGIVGRNGSGKSTLLKLIARITPPTTGRIVLRGGVTSLLEVGAGFHPELTGRENVFLSAAILGKDGAETRAALSDIVEFAGVEQFLDTQVKRYSSGMYMRLAFSVAAHLSADILLVDEVLAVGDLDFQRRCLSKMREVAQSGATVILVSHDLAAIEALSTKVLYLENGRIGAFGSTTEVLSRYIKASLELSGQTLEHRTDRRGGVEVRVCDIQVRPETAGDDQLSFAILGKPMQIVISYRKLAEQPIKSVSVSVGIYDSRGRLITYLQNGPVVGHFELDASRGRFICSLPRAAFAPGRYYINVLVESGDVLDWIQHACWFDIVEGDFFGTGKLPELRMGGVLMDQIWGHSQ